LFGPDKVNNIVTVVTLIIFVVVAVVVTACTILFNDVVVTEDTINDGNVTIQRRPTVSARCESITPQLHQAPSSERQVDEN